MFNLLITKLMLFRGPKPSLSSRLQGRLGVGGGGIKGGGVAKVQGDARLKIIQASRSKTVDAR